MDVHILHCLASMFLVLPYTTGCEPSHHAHLSPCTHSRMDYTATLHMASSRLAVCMGPCRYLLVTFCTFPLYVCLALTWGTSAAHRAQSSSVVLPKKPQMSAHTTHHAACSTYAVASSQLGQACMQVTDGCMCAPCVKA